jgi:hypothetical protein
VLLDHDISTVIFSPDGKSSCRLKSRRLEMAHHRRTSPEKQNGWLSAGSTMTRSLSAV